MKFFEVLAAIGFVLMAFAPATQALKSLRLKDASEVAIWWPRLTVLALALIAPSILTINKQVIFYGHFAALLLNLINLVVVEYYRRPRRDSS
ncbi:MAG: hypothetical protein Q8Q32_00195 [bacterium]|nr:hypothetical protein [bacterium]